MRNVVLSMVVPLDGYIEGENGDISWHVWDSDMQDYMADFLDTADTLFYGRRAYELMLKYWPGAEHDITMSETDRAFARKMNELNKIVFSRTLTEVEWKAQLVKENAVQKVNELKKLAGKDMILFGGAEIAATFMTHNLLDEYRLIINPVVLGKGKSLFNGTDQHFKLTKMETFRCGNVLLVYKPDKHHAAGRSGEV